MKRLKRCLVILIVGIVFQTCTTLAASGLDESASSEDELLPSSYVLPKQIFNDGKPFYAEKDPISGQFDFSSKKPAGIEPEVNEVIDPKEKIVFSSAAPNIHDFLNLPVKYSSSKFVYPLVSSSYANLKYQGNNKNFISSSRIHTASSATLAPKHNSGQKIAVLKTTTTTSTTTTTTPASTTTTTAATTTTRKPTSVPNLFERTTPKRKYNPTKKFIPISSSTESPSPTTERVYKYPKVENRPTRKFIPTSSLPTSTTEQTLPVTDSTTLPTTSVTPSSTEREVFLTTEKAPFRPMPEIEPSQFPLPADPSDVYNAVEHKNSDKKQPDAMTLSDILNSVTGEDTDSSMLIDEQGLDNQGNLMQPIAPSRPAPFSVHQPTKPAQSSTLAPRPSVVSENIDKSHESHYNNEYVQYQVQQPNMMQYHPMPNINNVVISPDQNSASFVLGSQQSVGSNMFVGSVEKESVFHKDPIQYGTVINEDITSIHAGPMGNSDHSQQSNIPMRNEDQVQEMLVSSNIRFPYEEQSVIENNQVPQSSGQVNGHAQPLNLPSQSVVFPPTSEQERPENHFMQNEPPKEIVFKPDTVETEIQKQEILTLNQHQLQHKVSFPQLGDSLTPPLVMEPPRPSLDNRQGPPRPYNGPAPNFHYNEFSRKPNPSQGMHRPNSDRPALPNILPQFRPNAKVSHGHPNFKEPGNFRVGNYPPSGPYANRQGPPPPPPQFAQRRNPSNAFNRYPMNVSPMMQGMPPQEAARRVYRVSPNQNMVADRMYLRRPLPFPQSYQQGPPSPTFSSQMYHQAAPHGYHQGSPPNFEALHQGPPRNIQHPLPSQPENYQIERHSSNQRHPENTNIGLSAERLAAFEEEDMVVNDPPKPVVSKDVDNSKLEPVVTLQMLKTKKGSSKESDADFSHEDEYSGKGQASYEQTGPSEGLYVVYPHKPNPNMDINESAETKDPLPAVAHFESTGGADYQNTPFSVIREQQQEPILMAKKKSQVKPTQQQTKEKFPYPLERPDSSYSDMAKHEEVDRYDRVGGVEIAPRIVSGGRPVHISERDSPDTPIAIAYTPTEPSVYKHVFQSDGNKYSNINLAGQVIPEIRDTQTEFLLNDELDTRGQNYEKDFMAPFYPSVSLGAMTGSPSNGWNVYQSSENPLHEKNKINRADTLEHHQEESGGKVNGSKESSLTYETTTLSKSDTDLFQPELQGGFKPIYPPGYNFDDEEKEAESLSRKEISVPTVTTSTSPLKLVSVAASTTSAPDLSSEKPVATTEKPTRKKSQIETSLEALLFGDDEDFEDDENNDRARQIS